MRKLLKWVGRVALGFVVIIAGVVIWAYTFEDELKARALAALQEGLTTEMSVGSMHFTVLRSFPNASLRCQNVLLTDTYGKGDTLIRAGELSFEIGLLKLLRGSTVFNTVKVSDGELRLRRDAQGHDNFHFWKTSDRGHDDNDDGAFDLEVVQLTNMHVVYDDLLADVFVELKSLQARLTGDYHKAVFKVSGSIDSKEVTVRTEGTAWLNGVPVNGEVNARIDPGHDDYRFNDLDLTVAGVRLSGGMHIAVLGEGVDLRLSADVRSIDLNTAIRLLPGDMAQRFADYEFSGRGSGRVTVEGLAGGGKSPVWMAQVDLRKTTVRHKGHSAELRSVECSARISGGGDNPGMVIIDALRGKLGGGRFSLKGSINGFAAPSMLLDVEGDVRLEDLSKFIGERAGEMQGRAAFTVGFAGRLPFDEASGAFDAVLLRQSRYNGRAELSGVSFRTSGMPRAIEGLNGRLNFEGDRAEVNDLNLRVGDSDFNISGALSNVLPWVFGKGQETLLVQAACVSRRVDLASFLTDEEAPRQDENAYRFDLPADIDLRLNISLAEFGFRSFSAKNMTGSIELNPTGLRFNPVNFTGCDGKVRMELAVTPSKSGYRVSATGLLTGIDIRKLFIQFEEFGQDFITSAHLRGRCNIDAIFTATMSPGLDIDPASIVSSADLRIEHGELIGLQSMQNISDYIRGNKLIAPFVQVDRLEERLRHIRFETLENRIEIKDLRIYFPMMDIKSSAMDIKASGSHWFDNRIDYSIGLYLRDILMRKERTDFGEIEDDGLGSRFFLSMTGTTDTPVFGYDRTARREVRKEERRAERETLRQIIREDLNPFKKKEERKTTLPPATPGSTLKVEWGDEKPEDQPVTPQDPPEKKRRWRLGGERDDQRPPLSDDDEDF